MWHGNKLPPLVVLIQILLTCYIHSLVFSRFDPEHQLVNTLSGCFHFYRDYLCKAWQMCLGKRGSMGPCSKGGYLVISLHFLQIVWDMLTFYSFLRIVLIVSARTGSSVQYFIWFERVWMHFSSIRLLRFFGATSLRDTQSKRFSGFGHGLPLFEAEAEFWKRIFYNTSFALTASKVDIRVVLFTLRLHLRSWRRIRNLGRRSYFQVFVIRQSMNPHP